MLKYSGHPFHDIGVATITAFSGKKDPALLTADDLGRVADYIEDQYSRNPLKSFYSIAFPNAWFSQPAFDGQPEKQHQYAERILRAFSSSSIAGDARCVFTGEPAAGVAFSGKTEPGRAFRQHVPLITGEGVMNFFPGGNAGLAISGKAALCIQAFPLGCAKCGGRLLAVHSDSQDLTYEFASQFLRDNRNALSMAHASNSRTMPESRLTARTALIEILQQVADSNANSNSWSVSLTAYHFTNSGQSNPLDRRNPPLEIHYLPLEITGFVWKLRTAEYRDQWNALIDRGWQIARHGSQGSSKGGSSDQPSGDGRPVRNYLFEDLFNLPDNAPSFVRRYFLRIPDRNAAKDDPRSGYSIRSESNLVSWKLTELFLKGVMLLDRERIREIRQFGDRLADYVSAENDRRFFMSFYSERRYQVFRNELIKVNLNHVKHGNPPLITLDPYITVFEEGDEVSRLDWLLARDLVLIRMIERLYQNGWLGKNQDVLSESQEGKESE